MITEEQCRHEVVDLHGFFQDWFNGELPATDEAFARFAGAMAPAFVMITPDGGTHDRAAILAMVRGGHGRGGYRIEIRDVRLRTTRGALALVTYEEWQTTAAGHRGRASTALLEAPTPDRLHWIHVHETWLPAD